MNYSATKQQGIIRIQYFILHNNLKEPSLPVKRSL